MALNKSKTAPWMKVMIIILAALMAMLVLLPSITSIMNQPAANTGTQTGSQNTSGTATYEGVSQQYAATVAANEAAIQKNPKDAAALKQQANTYFDWALTVRQTGTLGQQGLDIPLWKQAVTYYQRAVAANPKTDPAVDTDYAVALFYSGDTKQAVVVIDKVLKVQPDFPQALLNRGIFAESVQDTSTAVASYTKFVKLNPKDQASSVEYAKAQLAKLQGAK